MLRRDTFVHISGETRGELNRSCPQPYYGIRCCYNPTNPVEGGWFITEKTKTRESGGGPNDGDTDNRV